SIVYLAIIGSAITFVGLTVLLRHLTAQALSFLAMLLPFGALIFGAALYDEAITWRALAGAGLVAAGLLIAQTGRPAAEPREPHAECEPALATAGSRRP
ncbi:MAG TPA: EamA family transporter, partial [Thermoleophilaceae bacterium]|nr:EamA family transporter [Thermoleophilaceae bacterium]